MIAPDSKGVIVIPADWTTIPEKAFFNCTSASTVSFAGSKVNTIEDEAFSHSSIKTIEIPSSITMIGKYAFSDCKVLETVTFAAGGSTCKVGKGVFTFTAIETIEIPTTWTEVPENAFYKCANAKTVTFKAPSKVNIIQNSAFEDAGGVNVQLAVTLPFSVISVQRDAFRDCCSTVTFP